jgi:hypothetical protein
MDEITSLRAQLSAAEFLVNSLRAQLLRAEEQYAATRQFHRHHIPRGSTEIHAIPGSAQQQARGDGDVTDQAARGDLEQQLQRAFEAETPRHPPGHHDDQPYGGADDGYLPDATPNGNGDNTGGAENSDSEEEAPEPAEYPIPEGMTLPDVSVKRIFPDLSAVKSAVEAYALCQGWTPATKKRDRLRICMGCRTTRTCPFHVRAETCAEGARISSSKLLHTCQNVVHGGGVQKRHHVASLRFLREEVPRFMEVTPATPTKDIQEAIYARFGTRVSIGQCAKLRGRVRTKKPATQGCSRCGVQGHNKLTCTTVLICDPEVSSVVTTGA